EARDAELEPLEVAGRGNLLPEPPGHLRGYPGAGARHEVVGGVRLLPELEAIALVEPGQHAFGVHSERDGAEPRQCWILRRPVDRGGHERLDGPPRHRIEALEGPDDL